MTELEIVSEVVDHEATYRRSRRASRKQSVKLNKEFGKTILKTKVWPALVWSIVLSFCSVVNPLLTSFATNIQTQNLYAGMAMMKGQIPYGDFFGTIGSAGQLAPGTTNRGHLTAQVYLTAGQVFSIRFQNSNISFQPANTTNGTTNFSVTKLF